MKKILALLVLVLTFVSCGKTDSNQADSKELYLFNWSDYLPEEVIKGFEQETGIKVTLDLYSSNEEMYAKISQGGTGYDIIFPSADYQEIMIKQGMLQKIDKTKISNISELDTDMVKKLDFDPNMDYVVPYAIGAVGIAVNKSKVSNYEKSYKIFEDSSLKGKSTLLDDARQVLTSALVYNGLDPKSSNPADLAKAKETVMKWKSNILKFDSDSFGKGFANEEFYVVQGYFENISSQITEEQRKNMDFFIPEKGATMYIDSMVIPKDAKNYENALKFINYVHRPDVYVKIVDFFSIPSINKGAEKLRKTKAPYTLDDMKNTTLIKDLGDALEPQTNLWTEIKSN
ncbi:MAG: extracellular solute-binding protein [Fusobacteriaceae bacterium]|nr:extracellular solute-binding protein [Fusobacteriaceae bacterium]MBN2837246.1 extracellular solute-binding protein [Fusobacteriaceae bacterium]